MTKWVAPIAPVLDIKGVAHVTSSLDDVLDYWIDWSGVLQDGETIADSVWTVAPGMTAGALGTTGAKTYQYAGPASAVGPYALVNKVTTSAGRVYERTIIVDAVPRLS